MDIGQLELSRLPKGIIVREALAINPDEVPAELKEVTRKAKQLLT